MSASRAFDLSELPAAIAAGIAPMLASAPVRESRGVRVRFVYATRYAGSDACGATDCDGACVLVVDESGIAAAARLPRHWARLVWPCGQTGLAVAIDHALQMAGVGEVDVGAEGAGSRSGPGPGRAVEVGETRIGSDSGGGADRGSGWTSGIGAEAVGSGGLPGAIQGGETAPDAPIDAPRAGSVPPVVSRGAASTVPDPGDHAERTMQVADSVAVCAGFRAAEVAEPHPRGRAGGPSGDATAHGIEARPADGGIDVPTLANWRLALGGLERLLDGTLRAARAYLGVWDADTGKRTTIGPASEILGCDPATVEEALGLIHPADLERVRIASEQALCSGQGYEIEFRVMRPEGRVTWIHSRGSAIRDRDQRITGLLGICIDFTERMQARAELERLNRAYEIAISAAGLVPWRLRLEGEGGYEGSNDERAFGSAIADWKDLRTRVHDADLAAFDGLTAAESLATDEVKSIEFRVMMPDRSVRWIACTARVLRAEDGRAEELIGTFQDVSSARESRAALIDALDRLERIRRETGIQMWEWQRGARARIVGAPHEVTEPISFEVHPADRFRVLRQLARCWRSGLPVHVEFRTRSAGGWRWVCARGVRAQGADPVAAPVIDGLLADVSERRGIEFRLGEHEHWQEAAVEAAALNLWRVDVDTGERTGGALDVRWFGRSLTRVEEFIAYVHPEDRDRTADAWRRSLASRDAFLVEFRIQSPVCGERWVRTRGLPLRIDGRHDSGIWVGATVDVTDHKRVESELRAAAELAREAAEAKTAFLATVSHELRTPLNTVIGYAGLLTPDLTGDRQARYLDALRSGADQLLAVINDLLDFSRIDAGSMTLEAEPFDPVASIEGTIEFFAAAAEEKGVCLTLQCNCQTWPMMVGDAFRLRQVGLNLLSNAVKFTPAGSIRASIDCEVENGRRWFRFEVLDTGIGISRGALRRLFAPFRQGDESTARRFGGSGLGLSITSRIVELMGGAISVDSEPGRGSRFAVRIPWREDHSLPQAGFTTLGSRRIGVGCSSEVLAAVVREQVRVFDGVAVPAAGDAAAVVAAGDCDVLVVDSWEPGRGCGGNSSTDPAPPVVLLTGVAGPADAADPGSQVITAQRTLRPNDLNQALCRALASGKRCIAPQPRHEPRADFRAAEAGRRRELSVLVVEDSEVNRMLLLAQLEVLGYRADAVAGGMEALAAIRSKAYDVVFMDVEMPGMDGLATARAIRSRQAATGGAQPRIVALTAHAFADMRERALAAGMDEFVAKPVVEHNLLAVLKRAAGAAGT